MGDSPPSSPPTTPSANLSSMSDRSSTESSPGSGLGTTDTNSSTPGTTNDGSPRPRLDVARLHRARSITKFPPKLAELNVRLRLSPASATPPSPPLPPSPKLLPLTIHPDLEYGDVTMICSGTHQRLGFRVPLSLLQETHTAFRHLVVPLDLDLPYPAEDMHAFLRFLVTRAACSLNLHQLAAVERLMRVYGASPGTTYQLDGYLRAHASRLFADAARTLPTAASVCVNRFGNGMAEPEDLERLQQQLLGVLAAVAGLKHVTLWEYLVAYLRNNPAWRAALNPSTISDNDKQRLGKAFAALVFLARRGWVRLEHCVVGYGEGQLIMLSAVGQTWYRFSSELL